jgi:hypothetical protein
LSKEVITASRADRTEDHCTRPSCSLETVYRRTAACRLYRPVMTGMTLRVRIRPTPPDPPATSLDSSAGPTRGCAAGRAALPGELR